MSRSFLIVLPKEMRSARRAGREHHLDLGDRGGVEAGAELGEQLQHLRRRVCLHGVEHARVGQAPSRRSGSCRARRRGRRRGSGPSSRRLRRNSRMRAVMALFPIKVMRGDRRGVKVETSQSCDGDTTARRVRHPTMLPWIGAGMTRSARPARWTSLFGVRPLEGQRDQKSPFRRCFKPRPPLRAGCAGFASGCRSVVRKQILPSGGCPASCPDAHRPARDHRHVRNWATRDISDLRAQCKRFLRGARVLAIVCAWVAKLNVDVCACVNGSTRIAERMKATITAMPATKNSALQRCACEDLGRSNATNRSPTAQPAAKAAPNTSAPIRIAALTTVEHVQPVDAAGAASTCWWRRAWARNQYETGAGSSPVCPGATTHYIAVKPRRFQP